MGKARTERKSSGFVETVQTIVYAVLIALAIRTVAFEPFNIPSGSMLPTLLIGDYLFVSKYAYGYSRYSLPFGLPPFSGRILADHPERGDVVVFKTPRDNKTDFIKRIVGLPGDRIQMKDGVFYLNGEPVKREKAGEFRHRESNGKLRTYTKYRETLPSGVQYITLDYQNQPSDNTIVYQVPEGHYFAMGDNRDNSADSRMPKEWGGVGYIPAQNLVGRAEILFFSTDQSARLWEPWRWFQAARFKRFFQTIE